MPWPFVLGMLILVILLFVQLKKQGEIRSKIKACLEETADDGELERLLQTKGLRLLGTDAEIDDARVRLYRMRKDTDGMERELQKMNSRVSPIQLDYLWGIDRFFFALLKKDRQDAIEAATFTLQVADNGCKQKWGKKLEAFAALIRLLQPETVSERERGHLLQQVSSALEAEGGFSRVESAWLSEDLLAFDICLSQNEKAE